MFLVATYLLYINHYLLASDFPKPAWFHYHHIQLFKYCFINIARPHQLDFLVWFLFLISSFSTI